MRLKAVFVLLITSLPLIGFGQSFDPCRVGKDAAEFKISNGAIYFPRTVESSYTLRKLLELEYGIKDEVYDNGSDIQFRGEAECFFKVMKIEIDNRWGKNFLKKRDE